MTGRDDGDPSPALSRGEFLGGLGLTLLGTAAKGAPAGAVAVQAAKRSPAAQTAAIAQAADAFLALLSRGQRAVATRPFEPEAKGRLVTFSRAGRQDRPINGTDGADFLGEKYGQAVWSNYPIGGVPRTGLQTGFMSVAQRAAAMTLLRTALSPMGYAKIQDIFASDRAFASVGLPYAAGPDADVLGIFGKPSATEPWMFTFTGHHIGLNIILAGPNATMAPTHTGAEPTRFLLNGRIKRVLAPENDKAFALLEALSPAQRSRAIVGDELADLAYGPGQTSTLFPPEGLKGSAMDARQRMMMLSLVSEWAEMIHPAYSRSRMAEIGQGLGDTWFSWRGPTVREPGHNGRAYYRIQGPKLIVEFAPQTNDGDAALHVHTVYRDPTDDYGVSRTLPARAAPRPQ